MDRLHSLRALPLRVFAVALAAAALTGCSRPAKELRTSRQATGFVASIAKGGNPAGWRLARDATSSARQAWSDRVTIRDLGARLHHESYIWTCAFAKKAAEAHAVGPFSVGDREGVLESARLEGAKPSEIAPMLHDVSTLPESELVQVTAAVCE
jgi:hypothetical protein